MDYPSYLKRHKPVIEAAAHASDLEPELVAAIMGIESLGDPLAKSQASDPAEGLMQVNSITQRHLGIEDPYDAEEAVPAAAGYLRDLIDRFGSEEAGVSAYNTGPTAARRGRTNEHYIRRVMDLQRAMRGELDILEE